MTGVAVDCLRTFFCLRDAAGQPLLDDLQRLAHDAVHEFGHCRNIVNVLLEALQSAVDPRL